MKEKSRKYPNKPIINMRRRIKEKMLMVDLIDAFIYIIRSLFKAMIVGPALFVFSIVLTSLL